MTSMTVNAVVHRTRHAAKKCLWTGCNLTGRFFNVRGGGAIVTQGRWCNEHDRAVAGENLERAHQRQREGRPWR